MYNIAVRRATFSCAFHIQPRYVRALTTTNVHRHENNGNIKHVTVVGGGIMGSGVAQSCAQSGFQVTVVDNDEYSQKCMVSIMRSLDIISKKKFPDEPKSAKRFTDNVIKNITTMQDISQGCANADFIIETVIENLPIKQKIFQKIDQVAPPHAILTSNTSSLCIEDISKVTSRGDRFGGLHFFNPVWNMRAVEVIRTLDTSDETFEKIKRFCEDLGKIPIPSPDTLGFIVNRLIFPYLMEALRLLERGHATVTDIDTAMKLGAGYPKGPFEIMDIIGLDTVKTVIDGWHYKEPDNPLFFPSEILNSMVLESKLGQKTGRGFYKYKHTLY